MEVKDFQSRVRLIRVLVMYLFTSIIRLLLKILNYRGRVQTELNKKLGSVLQNVNRESSEIFKTHGYRCLE